MTEARFPALHGRASLKPVPCSVTVIISTSFSRPSRAGLIEAVGLPDVRDALSVVFPPFTGGPH